MRAVIIMIAAMLFGCEKRDPRLMTPIDCEDAKAVDALGKYIVENDLASEPIFGRPKTFEGLWLAQFEYRIFIEGADELSEFEVPWVRPDVDFSQLPRLSDETWIEIHRNQIPKSVQIDDFDYDGEIYFIRFTGRAALEGQPMGCFGYGHGDSARLVVVDELHSIRHVGSFTDRYPSN